MTSSELDLRWAPSLTSGERGELRENPAFAAGEGLIVGGLVVAGAGIGLLVAGLAGKSPDLTTAGAIAWPLGATIHVVGLGLFTSATKPYFRAQREAQGPGLHIPGPLPR